MNKRLFISLFALFIVISLVINVNKLSSEANTTEQPTLNPRQIDINKDCDVKEVYITVMPVKKRSSKYFHTFKELNQNTSSKEDIKVKVLFQEGKDGAPSKGLYGYGLTDSNGVMELRGQSARTVEQKSYKITLQKKADSWNGFKVINLNKHYFDNLRMRNKLSFDYFNEIPNFISLRTQFVHVYIKDFSEGSTNQEYKDFGLFTHIENVDKDFLKVRGLDPKAALYKVQNFEFYTYPDELKLKDDIDYDENEFEKRLEIKGTDNHEKLLSMLRDVNNPMLNINQIINKHFDRDNYLTWLAINQLVGNVDCNSRNFYLYSPKDSSKWYFIPWDYDKSWGAYLYRGTWQEGISVYWGVVLHQRFLKNKENLQDLTEKIEYLSTKIFSDKNTQELLNQYKPIVTYFLTREPDNQRNKMTTERINAEFNKILEEVAINKKSYYKSIEKPMPVFMAKPIKSGDFLTLKWNDSYDFQGDSIEYSFDLSDTPTFDKIVQHREGIEENEYVFKGLKPGIYYWRLKIRDSKGNQQQAFNIYKKNKGHYYFGVDQFVVNY